MTSKSFLLISFILLKQLNCFDVISSEMQNLLENKIDINEKKELINKIESLKNVETENIKLSKEIQRLKDETEENKGILDILQKISSDPEMENIEKELSELNKIKEELEKTNAEKNTRIRNLQRELEKITTENQKLSSFKEEISKLKIEKENLEKQLEEQTNKKQSSVNKLVGKLAKMNVNPKYVEKMKQKLTRSPQVEEEYNNMIENLLTKTVRSIPIEYLIEDLIE